MKSLGRIIRSVKAFGRELSRGPEESAVGANPRIGLALGGGFARGIAHIGILKVLEEENIPVSFIAGTSVGALIGAAYCGGLSAAELEKVAGRVRFRDFARWTLSRYGFATNRRMIGFLNSILTVKNFEDLSIPLAVTATDFATGEAVVFHSGPLVEPVRASCAYPGMFLPVNIRGRLLVDGMLAYAVPTHPLRDMGADRVVAVHLKGCWTRRSGPRHIFDVIGQCFAIAQDMNTHVWKQAADLVVEPDVKAFEYDDFAHSSDLVRAGETVMRQALPEIRKWLSAEPQQNARDQKTPKRGSVPQPAAIPAD